MTRSLPQRGGPQPTFEQTVGGVVARLATSSNSVVVPSAKHLTVPAASEAKVRVVEPHRHPCLLSSLGSVVTQAKLDESGHRFNIPRSILMRVPRVGELPYHPREDTVKIAFPLIAFECRVRLPLAPFIKRLLSEFPLHLFQLAPALWEHYISQCVLWHRIHG